MNTAVQLANELNDFEPIYFNEDIIRREAERYLFFPGDVIGARRKQERADLRHGGEEVGSACLVRTNRFIRRCRITPLERWGEPMPVELMPDGAQPIGLTAQNAQGEQGFTSFRSGLQGFQKFPGDEITWILASADNSGMRKGIVELTALRYEKWDEFQKSGIQELIFPNYPQLPPTLREIEAMIQSANSRDSDVVRIKEEALLSCGQFRLWATARMDAEDMLIRIGTVGTWTYTYSDLADTLIPQLERGRADQYLHNQQAIQGNLAEQQSRLTDAVVAALGKTQSNGVDVGEIVSTLQAQMAEQNRLMMEQNQKFLGETLAKLFGPDEKEQPKEAPKPNNGGPKKPNNS